MGDLFRLIDYNYLYWMVISYFICWFLLLLLSRIIDFTRGGNPLSSIIITWLIAIVFHFIVILSMLGIWGNELYQSGEEISYILFNYIWMIVSVIIDIVIIIMLIINLNNSKNIPRSL